VARIHDVADVLSESHEEGGTHIKARVPVRHVSGLVKFSV